MMEADWNALDDLMWDLELAYEVGSQGWDMKPLRGNAEVCQDIRMKAWLRMMAWAQWNNNSGPLWVIFSGSEGHHV